MERASRHSLMPLYDRAICNLILDNPEADGKKTAWGVGRDWVAAEPKLGGQRRTPDIAGQYGWDYAAGEFEYIEPLKAIAPKGKATLADMSLAASDVIHGKFRESPTVGKYMGHTWLQFYDARPGLIATNEHGYIIGKNAVDPAVHLLTWAMPTSEDETDPSLFEVVFYGDGTVPAIKVGWPRRATTEAATSGMGDEDPNRRTCPYLAGWVAGTGWMLIDEFRGGGGSGIPVEDGSNARFESIRIEYTEDGWILVNFASTDTTWAYSGKWRDREGNEHEFRMTSGKIGILVSGQTVDFNINDLEYGTGLQLKPSLFFHTLLSIYNQTRTYRQIRTIEAGVTDIVGTFETPSEDVSRPVLTFSTTNSSRRAIFYRLQEYRDPTFGGAVSAPFETQDNANFKLERASGHLNNDWRGSRMEADVRALTGGAMVHPEVNAKAQVEVSCDDGLNYHTQFQGYVLAPEVDRDPTSGLADGHFEAADGIDARLARHKIGYECSFSEWDIPTAYRHLLMQGGVPAALIDVDPAINTDPVIDGGMGDHYYLPAADPRGEAHLQFRPEDDLVTALDTICKIRGLKHGYNPATGHYRIYKPVVHVAGYSDLTLDEDLVGPESILLSFKAARSAADFYNVLYVMVGEGWTASAKLFIDLTSIADLADDWSEWVYEPDADDIQLIADVMWEERERLSQMVFWRTAHHPNLMPDHYVKVDEVRNTAITAGTIFQIEEKNWRVENGKFSQEFSGVIVEEGP